MPPRISRRHRLAGALTLALTLLLVMPLASASLAAADDCTPAPAVLTCGDGDEAPDDGGSTSPPPEQQPDGSSPPPPASPRLVQGPDAELLELANGERARAGLPPIHGRTDAADLAGRHSLDMAAAGDIWHNDAYFTAATRERLNARKLAENVAMGPSAARIHQRLMESPGHRANLLDPDLTGAGFAVADNGEGTLFVTQAFLQPAAAQEKAPATAATRPRGGSTPASPTTALPAAAEPLAASAEVAAPETKPLVLAADNGPVLTSTSSIESGGVVTRPGAVATVLLSAMTAGLTAARRRGLLIFPSR